MTLNDGPGDVMLRIGSNGSVKVFLNGRQVWNNRIERSTSVDSNLVPVTLPKRLSTILLKIGQAGVNWDFYFRISERDLLDIPKGLLASLEPPR